MNYDSFMKEAFELADKMQLVGIDIDKNAIQRIECGKRFVTDIEIVAFAKIFNITYEDLLNDQLIKKCLTCNY